ncbi:hypothetical protein GCM10009007_13950 [Formosimonas limnophila]|uniref:VUT family protein n=1 Tax=Formosimonas limnophila TaxID=1384487 RepID=A0A8J3CN63_9BURK|nr:VUT family protein [Formosimonas limnophila]GHA73991.1 hypothetical protein GCM10009007_13950 [Formosimonas limnophila]
MLYIWTFLYVASVLFANLYLDHFIELGILGKLSWGTLFFALVFTLRDKLHQFGLRAVFIAIGLAVLTNILAAVYLNTPERFIAASFIAILVGELADTAMYQRLTRHSWLTRALSSNAISIPLDTLLFNLLAFYGDMTNTDIGKIIWADILFKTVIAGGLAFALNNWRQKRTSLA